MKTKNIVYDALEKLLLNLEFQPVKTNNSYKAFQHSSSNALIILPDYKPTDKIDSVHCLTVRRTLREYDLMDELAFEDWIKTASEKQNLKEEIDTIDLKATHWGR